MMMMQEINLMTTSKEQPIIIPSLLKGTTLYFDW